MPNKRPKPKPKPNDIPDHNPTFYSNFCEQKVLVQDQICCDFMIPAGKCPTIIYLTNAERHGDFAASGSIKNCSDTSTLKVEFVNETSASNAEDGSKTITIPPEGCFSFTLTHFNTIRATTNSPEGMMNAGEFCITPRYRV